MNFRCVLANALLIALGLLLSGCAKEGQRSIVGKWRAERFEVMSLKLPIGPELDISSASVRTGSDITIPISEIKQDGNEVTLETDLIGLTFYFVDDDRMYVHLPVIGQIYYQRVGDQARSGSAPAPVPAQRRASIAPVANPEPALPPQYGKTQQVQQAPDAEPAYYQPYEHARTLVRQGDYDGAVRSLHAAFSQGFRDTARLDQTPEFDVLKGDVRYQALVVRYGGQ
jgi:hypothetical protein